MIKRRYFNILAAAALLTGVSQGAVPITGPTTYTQNFDSLPLTNVTWVDNSTVPGWYAQANNGTPATLTLQVTDGSGAALNGLLNMGATGSSERALGSKATSTGNFANMAYAVQFRNTSANTLRLTQVKYRGEYWRGNSVANTPEQMFLFASTPTNTPITNILSGGSSTNPTAGAGFNAIGASPNWEMTNPSTGAIDGNSVFTDVTTTTNILVGPNQYVMIKWIDTNEANTDGYHGIDNVEVQFEAVDCAVFATAQNIVRKPGTLPADPSDDVVDFTLVVTGSGTISSNWTITSPASSSTFGTTAPYVTPRAFTDVPVSEFGGNVLTLTVEDQVTAGCNTNVEIRLPKVIGSNLISGSDIYTTSEPLGDWVIDDAAKTATQVSAVQGDDVINSTTIDLSAIGTVVVSADLDAIAGGSSGFEAADSFALQLIIDGGAPISILGPADVDNDGRLEGAAADPDPNDPGLELPDANDTNVTRNYSFLFVVPASANSLVIRIIGNSNSPAETLILKNLRVSSPPAGLYASPGAVSFDNSGTPDPADDKISAVVAIEAIGLPGTGWTSGLVSPEGPASGLYSVPTHNFTVLASTSPRTVTLTDNDPSATTGTLILVAPARTLTVGTPTNIVRHENGPGMADDTVTFDVTIAGSNGGPGWKTTTAGVTPTSGAFGNVSFTMAAPLPASPANVTIEDISYPATNQTIQVPYAPRYVIGQRDIGGGLQNIITPISPAPSLAWVNNPVLRTLTMNDGDAIGGLVEKVVMSEVIDLSGVVGQNVFFSANLHVNDLTSGFEPGDVFTLQLIFDGDTLNPVTVNPGYDQDSSGRMNGAELTPATVGPPPVSGPGSFDHSFAHTIPDSVNTVQIVIIGLNDSTNETMRLENVLLSLGSHDTDGDGMPDSYEDANGLDKNNPADAALDLDGDGQSNLAEFRAGTEPDDPSSNLRITTVAYNSDTGVYTVTWTSVAGKSYKVLSSPDMTAGSWFEEATVVGAPNANGEQSRNVNVIGSPSKYFFKVIIP